VVVSGVDAEERYRTAFVAANSKEMRRAAAAAADARRRQAGCSAGGRIKRGEAAELRL
jgi:hypothetical protein